MTKFHSERSELEISIRESCAAVVGTLDSGLRIDRISGEAGTLLDCPPESLLGESILSLLAESDVPTFLKAYAEAATSQRGVTVEMHLCTEGVERRSRAVLCDVFVVPLQPSPGCAFVLRPAANAAQWPTAEHSVHIVRPAPGEEPERAAAGRIRGVSEPAVPGLGRLTTRERQIVARLLDGHRPPGIARALFLSQSTVRNHLASVFRKLGVTSQEGLLELFRAAGAGRDDTSPAEREDITQIS
jgi:DNA-binding CsgD family transcriptional regulator